jgi:ABC-type sugar transport system substrate-binding protein
MKKLNFLVSLITNENDFQLEQAKASEDAARKLGVSVQITYAANDAINQSQQLLSVIQSSGEHPDAIIVEPVGGTGLPHVARAAVSAGIGWVVLNRETDYISQLRSVSPSPVFCVSANHLEAGRIQGQHMAAFVPKDGTAFYIQGPSTTAAARQRALGLDQTKPVGIKLIHFKGNWTEESAYKAVSSWMKLSTSKKTQIDMVVGQNDDMAMGARKALQEQADMEVRDKWLSVPFSGCDGLQKTGQAFVRSGLFAATIVIPPNTSVAMELLTECFRSGKQPSELVLTTPVSFPPLEDLGPSAFSKSTLSTAR